MRTHKVNFSYNYSRGSVKQRMMKSAHLSEKMFDKILKLYKSKNVVPIKVIEKEFKENMPEKIFFNMKKLNNIGNTYMDGCTYSRYINDELIGYTLELPTIDNKLPIQKLPILAHEATHLFDNLFLPKRTKNGSIMSKTGLSTIGDELYDNYFYNTKVLYKPFELFQAKAALKKALKCFPDSDKILILNYIKDSLMTEINAYRTEEKCAQKLNFFSVYSNAYGETEKRYQFINKLSFINKMLYETISKSRYVTAYSSTNSLKEKIKLTSEYFIRELKSVFM